MNKQLQEKLYKKYPKLFIQKDWPKTETCMCWGVGIGDGWYNLIDTLCSALEIYMETENWQKKPEDKDYLDLQFTQIKTKFGSLRIHIDNGDNFLDDKFVKGMIYMTETMANNICYHCGNPGVNQLKIGKHSVCVKCLRENKI